MSVYDQMTRNVAIGALKTFQNLFAASASLNANSVRLSIAFSKLQADGSTILLDTIDTGIATDRGQGDPSFHSDNIEFNSDEQRGALAALTLRARSDAAVFTRDPDIIATGTIQLAQLFLGGYENLSVEVKQVNNVLFFTWIQTQV
jgi:hypothetical protein